MESLEDRILERIKIYRLRAGLSQENMASYLGYSGRSGYSSLERGKNQLTVDQLEKLLLILQIPEEELQRIIHRFYEEHR